MRILKFGGSSVGNPESIKQVAKIIRDCSANYPGLAVVISAQSGVTDSLVRICDMVNDSKSGIESVIQELEQRHLDGVRKLIPLGQQPSVMAEIMTLCNELSDIVRGAILVGEVTPRTRDLVLSFGERLSAFLISNVVKAEIPGAIYTDARELITTDSFFGWANVDFNKSTLLINKYFQENEGLKIITGFIASTENGQTTTLGRSGSDYTASIIGAAVDAEAIEIWSDVDGVMTADPGYVPEARSISQLSYNEAMEMSHFGARILFPSSLQPVMEKRIPVYVRNTFNPGHPGTLINSESKSENGFIKGITSLGKICIVNVEGSGMVGVAGVSARMFSSLSQQEISVILISQASSEHSICIALLEKDAEKACKVLRNTFSAELSSGHISTINCENNMSIVAVVGENMRHMPGVASRVFSPLGRNGINIKAISQGSSELNISFVISKDDLKKALRILHQALFNSEIRQLNLFIAGTGSVGSRLLDMIRNHDDYLVRQKIDLRLCGLINSRRMIVGDDPINKGLWRETVSEGKKASLGDFVDQMLLQNNENSVFVDVTAADEPVEYYDSMLLRNIAIVAANKRANTRSLEKYHELHNAASLRNVPFHYETNVGAGLPVINVIRNLIAGGDKILSIEAVVSGTVNWLLSEYDGSIPFSSLVMQARELGYTEPDPRDDLSGMDVARKCLVLGRECGIGLEMSDISVEQLMPQDAGKADTTDDLESFLRSYDNNFNERYQDAQKHGRKLRYVASVKKEETIVKLIDVDAAHPFYGLKGSENCIVLTTEYYSEYPIVIKGPGAGVDVTAAGLLADIVRIAEGIRI